MNTPKNGRTGLPFFAGLNIRKYMVAISGNLKSGTMADTRYEKIVCRAKNLERKRFISSSSVGGRWDMMVLNKKVLTGDPHTAEFVDMWNGWGSTIRTISQAISKNSSPSGH